MASQEITLEDSPERLQEKVNEFLQKWDRSKLLTIMKYEDTPYYDKSIVSTRWVAFLEHGNLLTTLETHDCSKPEWDNFKEVRENYMIAGYMQVFFEKSRWFNHGKAN